MARDSGAGSDLSRGGSWGAVTALRRTTLLLVTIWLVAGAGPAGAIAAPAAKRAPRRIAWGHTATLRLVARPVSTPIATPEGPGRVELRRAHGRAARARSGEGIITLTMRSSGTSWASSSDTSTVAEVSVDGGSPQTILLFAGRRKFTYEGFLGPMRAGPHRVSILDSSSLAHASDSPAILLTKAQLGIIPQSDPDYWKDAYAPFIYGRSSSATGYIPLLTDVTQSRAAGGARELSYTYIISAHDQGDSIVPAYQWGTWGRMTDIVSVIDETVARDGTVTSAEYASCGCEGTPYPDGVEAPSDSVTKSFKGHWLGHHPMLRDATATNYLSDEGTTNYRFQLAPVAGPRANALRETVMDAHPWTYEISNEELPREHAIDTSPDSVLVGDYRQYAIVDANITTTGSVAIEFGLRLAGSSTWYTTDYAQMTGGVGCTFPFHDGGHNRWVIKLPMNWAKKRIAALRITATHKANTPTPTVAVQSLRLLEVTDRWKVRARAYPHPSITDTLALVPDSLPS